jgi:putative endonuclease
MFFVYILASRPFGAIYVGSSSNLRQRVEQHRAGTVSAHTKKYEIHTLVYFETYPTREEAIHRERQLKRYKRLWKNDLIIAGNPEWQDICDQIPL